MQIYNSPLYVVEYSLVLHTLERKPRNEQLLRAGFYQVIYRLGFISATQVSRGAKNEKENL